MNALLTGMEEEFIQAALPALRQQDGSLGTCPAALSPPVLSDSDKAAPPVPLRITMHFETASISGYQDKTGNSFLQG